MKTGVHIEVDARLVPTDDEELLRPLVARACGVRTGDIRAITITRRSLDARQKPKVKVLYAITAELREGVTPHGKLEPPADEPQLAFPENRSGVRQPLVVGTGPLLHGTAQLRRTSSRQ